MADKLFHQQQLHALQRQFPPMLIKPTDNLQEIFFRAGIAAVLKYVESNTAMYGDAYNPRLQLETDGGD